MLGEEAGESRRESSSDEITLYTVHSHNHCRLQHHRCCCHFQGECWCPGCKEWWLTARQCFSARSRPASSSAERSVQDRAKAPGRGEGKSEGTCLSSTSYHPQQRHHTGGSPPCRATGTDTANEEGSASSIALDRRTHQSSLFGTIFETSSHPSTGARCT